MLKMFSFDEIPFVNICFCYLNLECLLFLKKKFFFISMSWSTFTIFPLGSFVVLSLTFKSFILSWSVYTVRDKGQDSFICLWICHTVYGSIYPQRLADSSVQMIIHLVKHSYDLVKTNLKIKSLSIFFLVFGTSPMWASVPPTESLQAAV